MFKIYKFILNIFLDGGLCTSTAMCSNTNCPTGYKTVGCLIETQSCYCSSSIASYCAGTKKITFQR